MSEIVHIPFHGDDLLTTDYAGKPHIVLKPAIEAIGLSYDAQRVKLQGKSWARTALIAVRQGDGRLREVVAVDVRTFLMLLATVDEKRVAEHVRPKLVAYQSEVADVIEAYWTRGHAVNPRAVRQLGPVTYDWDEAAAVMRQDFDRDITTHELTRLLRAAGVLKMDCRHPREKFKYLFWFTGTHWEIHQHAVPLLLRKAEDVGRQLQEYRFIQGRFEFDELDTASPPRLAS